MLIPFIELIKIILAYFIINVMENHLVFKKNIIGIIILLLIFGYLLYFYPVQNHLAEKAFSDYISYQGISKENIQSKKIYKDYKQNGYYIDVVYKDDPNYRYEYKYFSGKSNKKFNMRCIVFNEHNVEVTRDKIKYPYLN